MGNKAAKTVFYGVALILFLWTASLTIAFVKRALPNEFWVVPFFALVVFDGGTYAWLMVFLKYARGAWQRWIAVGLCIFDFIGVALMVLAEVLLGGQSFTEAPANLGMYAVWGIAVWTVVNVAGVLAFHIMDPANQEQMAIQNEMDAIKEGALKNLEQRRTDSSMQLADELGAQLFAKLLAELATEAKQRDEKIPASGKTEQAAATASANGHGGPVANPTQAR